MAVLQLDDTRLETVDQGAQLDILGCRPDLIGGEGGVLGYQPGALGEELLGPLGAIHTIIFNDLARSVVDNRAPRLRAT